MDQNYVRGLVNQANRIRGAKIEEVRAWVKNADLVIGVFNDETQPNGVGLHIIKGQRLLMTSVTKQETMDGLRQLCLPCRSMEEALALQNVLGEPDPKH